MILVKKDIYKEDTIQNETSTNLDNKVVEEKLQNGPIGEVHEIGYMLGEKVGQKGAQPTISERQR